MSSFLAQACAESVERVAAATAVEPLARLRERALATPPPPPFGAALRAGIIAEVKRASPSRGVIAAGRDAAGQARAYAAGGAAAVSVLTEPAHFHGRLDDLAAVASAVGLPLLRKDFIVDPYQLFEARVSGAAAALLLVAALDDAHLAELAATAVEAGVEVLVEAHDAGEVERAAALLAGLPAVPPPVVGINARDLQHLGVDRSVFGELVDALPAGAVVVAESGVTGPDDVTAYLRTGADAVLVGEHLMTADDPTSATAALVEAARTSHRGAALTDPA